VQGANSPVLFVFLKNKQPRFMVATKKQKQEGSATPVYMSHKQEQ